MCSLNPAGKKFLALPPKIARVNSFQMQVLLAVEFSFIVLLRNPNSIIIKKKNAWILNHIFDV